MTDRLNNKFMALVWQLFETPATMYIQCAYDFDLPHMH